MNNKLRKQIEETQDEIYAIKIRLEELNLDVDNVLDEELEAFDNIIECMQRSDKGAHSESAIYDICSASECIAEACDSLESVCSLLEDSLL